MELGWLVVGEERSDGNGGAASGKLVCGPALRARASLLERQPF